MGDEKPPILHIFVVGFHHKQGCQVEFSYPPLVAGTTGKNECPSGWKYLPTLALPDGSHNFDEDSVFFNLPSLLEPTESVYGVSCYRQIPVEQLKIRTADVTRSTVQKSVGILARLPIYGYIEVKLALIADTFFEQGDFSRTELLVKAYQQLNACLLDDDSPRSLRHFHVGISLRNIMLQWRHKTLILFKLLLLQRRVVCFGSPVRNMCVLILGIASLIPRLLEKGFQEVACVRTSRPLSPMPDFTDCLQREAAALQQQLLYENAVGDGDKISPDAFSCAEAADETVLASSAISAAASSNASVNSSPLKTNSSSTTHSTRELQRQDSTEEQRAQRSNSLTREASMDTLGGTLAALAAVNPDEYRAPISIFASGNLCLPYLSLPYMDLLSDTCVLSYIIGTSNVLFQQKRNLADVLVDIECSNINSNEHDAELRRQLQLSTEDLRFMDYLLKHVQMPKEDAEGSEQWIREQFRAYTLALLRTAAASDASSKDIDHFNASFMHAFKRTQCFQEWYDVRPDEEFFAALPAGHPFAGTLSVADMKLKLAHTMQNSESGRKINQAVNNTSRAVGGAITQAKGAFSNWWSSITTAPANVAGDDGAGTSIASSTAGAHATEISVTFQNSIDIDAIEVGVSIHMQDAHKKISNASSSTNGSEKTLDSAEELNEELDTSAVVQQLPTQKPTARGGIVEIGKEAELLDNNAVTQTARGLDVAQAANQGAGDIFIA